MLHASWCAIDVVLRAVLAVGLSVRLTLRCKHATCLQIKRRAKMHYVTDSVISSA